MLLLEICVNHSSCVLSWVLNVDAGAYSVFFNGVPDFTVLINAVTKPSKEVLWDTAPCVFVHGFDRPE